MNKIAMKMVDLNIKTAAGITLGMLKGNMRRNLAKILTHKPGSLSRIKAIDNMENATYQFGRELAATRGQSSPKAMKKIIKGSHRYNKMHNIANKFNKPELAAKFGRISNMSRDMYSNYKQGINLIPKP